MKVFFEKLKDILYDSIDYIIMLTIIIGVVFLIGWRLDGLFAKDSLQEPSGNEIIQDIGDRPVTNPDADLSSEDDDEEDLDPADENKSIQVHIPSGSISTTVGKILADHGLVGSTEEFVSKSQELKLDTKLQSGDFTIASNSTIEEILKIITK